LRHSKILGKAGQLDDQMDEGDLRRPLQAEPYSTFHGTLGHKAPPASGTG